MMKLRRIANSIKPYVESDFYVPIKVRFGHRSNTTEPTNYLEIKGNTKLLEIGIGRISGEISSITLVLSPKVLSEMPQKTSSITRKKVGLPAFGMKEWKTNDYYANETIDFNIYLKDNHILIELSPERIVLAIINEGYTFGFDAHRLLCTIEMDISDAEKALLEENLRANGKL